MAIPRYFTRSQTLRLAGLQLSITLFVVAIASDTALSAGSSRTAAQTPLSGGPGNTTAPGGPTKRCVDSKSLPERTLASLHL